MNQRTAPPHPVPTRWDASQDDPSPPQGGGEGVRAGPFDWRAFWSILRFMGRGTFSGGVLSRMGVVSDVP